MNRELSLSEVGTRFRFPRTPLSRVNVMIPLVPTLSLSLNNPLVPAHLRR